MGDLIDLWAVFQLSDPLPWVFPTVGEEDIRAVDFVAAAVVLLSVGDLWVRRHVHSWENHATHVREVLLVDVDGAHAVDVPVGLVPAELVAVLPGPLTAVVGSINSGVENLRAGTSHVIFWLVTVVHLKLNCGCE